MSAQPRRSIDLKIRANEYTIEFPKTGQQLDINVLKSRISNGRYDDLKYSIDPELRKSALVVDVIATFNVMLPDFKKHLNVSSILELQESEMDELLQIYVDEYLPWFEEWKAFLSKPKEAVETEK